MPGGIDKVGFSLNVKYTVGNVAETGWAKEAFLVHVEACNDIMAGRREGIHILLVLSCVHGGVWACMRIVYVFVCTWILVYVCVDADVWVFSCVCVCEFP